MSPLSQRVPARARSLVGLARHGRTMATAGALTLVLGLAAVQGLPTGGEAPHRSLRATDAVPRTPEASRSEALLQRAGCSSTGLDGATPRSAILRATDGHLRLVDFDRGWASFTGDAPGDLLAVCLSPAG